MLSSLTAHSAELLRLFMAQIASVEWSPAAFGTLAVQFKLLYIVCVILLSINMRIDEMHLFFIFHQTNAKTTQKE